MTKFQVAQQYAKDAHKRNVPECPCKPCADARIMTRIQNSISNFKQEERSIRIIEAP